MLVLSRQRNQAIMIGDDIEITVEDIRNNKVRLGIAAPRSTRVHRKEVWEQIRRECQEHGTGTKKAVCVVCGKGLDDPLASGKLCAICTHQRRY